MRSRCHVQRIFFRSCRQVFDHHGNVIPRLLEAGELGSMFSDLYQNGSYLTEAMITGRGAARSALALQPSILPGEEE